MKRVFVLPSPSPSGPFPSCVAFTLIELMVVIAIIAILAGMLAFVESPYLRMNMDTGNTYIAGQDPVAFLKQFLPRVSHVHIKDVSESLAKSVRGGMTGIAVSHCALGQGVNADNITSCLKLLKEAGYAGTLSMECEGACGPMIEQSLTWLRETLRQAGIQEVV